MTMSNKNDRSKPMTDPEFLIDITKLVSVSTGNFRGTLHRRSQFPALFDRDSSAPGRTVSISANLGKWNLNAISPLFSSRKTWCQEADETSAIDKQQLRKDIAIEKARVQGELDRLDNTSCLGCLVTGVGTCLGLAGYFGYLAMEEMEVKPVTRLVRQRIAFFGVAAVGWVGAGAYRLYLG